MIELGITVLMQPTINELLAVSIMALQLLRESYFGLPLSTMMLSNLLQETKAQSPISETELPMFTLVRLPQRANAIVPMDVTELGMSTLVRPVQDWNA